MKSHIRNYSYLSLLTFFIFSFFIQDSVLLAQNLNQWVAKGPYTEWPYPFPRHEHAFVEANGKMYLIGGRGNKAVQIYDPITNTWEMGTQPPLEIHHMQLVHLAGKIYVIGAQTGQFPHEDPVGSVLIYNIVTDSWTWGPSIPQHRQRGSAGVVVHEGKIYVVCGIIDGHSSGWVNWLDVYDPQTGEWQQLPSAPRSRDHFHAALVGDKIVVAGGRRSGASGYFNATVGEVDVFDISENSWTTIGSIPTQRAGCTAIAVGEEVIIMGGESGGQQNAHEQVEAINIETGVWRTLDPLNQGRHGIQATIYNNAIYVAGGSIQKGANELPPTDQNYVEEYRFAPPDIIEGGSYAPIATISSSETIGNIPVIVDFDASQSIDYDGEITSYIWDFGDSTTAEGIHASHTFSQAGVYTVTLTVTDNEGLTGIATTEVNAIDPTMPVILFVSELNPSDQIIKTHLQNMGYNVMAVNGFSAVTEDAIDKNLIIISSSVNSSHVQSTFTDVDVPIINWEPNLYDDLLMTQESSDTDYGWLNTQSILLANTNHPLAGNQQGTLDLFSNQQRISWGLPLANAAQVGVQADDQSKVSLFGYDTGDQLAGGSTAPARRIGFPMGDNGASSFTDEGWLLFDVAVCWAMGCNPISVRATITPSSGSLPLTVNFDGSSSSHLYGNIASYFWQFGTESAFSQEAITSFTYNSIGSYYAKLMVIDQYGNTAIDSFLIEVMPAPPTADWVVSGDSAYAPANVQFDGRGSFDLDGEIVKYYWDYGDGSGDSLVVADLAPAMIIQSDTIIITDSLGIETVFISYDTIFSDSLALDIHLQPTHVYEQAGNYMSVLTTIDNDGGIDTDTAYVEIINMAPVAKLAGAGSGFAPLYIVFNGNSSYDRDGYITQYIFEYGDGEQENITVDSGFNDSLLMVRHIYTTSGVFQAMLTVVDNLGASHTDTVTIEVLNTGPIANASTNLYEGFAPLTVILSSDSSYDNDGHIVSTNWEFPDGSTDSTAMTSYTFERWGTYTVALEVTDNGGISSRDFVQIQILNQAPEAIATADHISGVVPLTVNFSGTGSNDIDGDIVNYIWDFDHTSQVVDDSATITYEEIGTYQVTLTVIDDAGDSASTNLTITVKPETRDVLLVVGSSVDNLNEGDQRVQEILEGMNYNVLIVEDSESQLSDAADKALILISSTCQSGDVNTKFTQVDVPLLTWESFLYDDLQMTAPGQGSNYEYGYGQSSIQILDGDHVLSAGLSGEQIAYTGSGIMPWGSPLESAINIATLVDDASKSVIFAYEEGVDLYNMVAPARRLGFFIQDTEAALLTNNGLALFEAAICWTAGCTQPQARMAPQVDLHLNAYPNPLRRSDNLTISVNIEDAQELTITIVDPMGKAILRQSMKVNPGMYEEEISLNKYAAGVYTLIFRHTQGIQSKKIVVID